MDDLVILRRRKLGMSSARGIAEKSVTGIRWTRNDFAADRLPHHDEVVIRWGCTSNVASKRVINTAAAIHGVNDKGTFRMLLDEHELCPQTWRHPHDVPLDIINKQGVIVRPNSHAQGRNLFLCRNQRELLQAWAKCQGGYIGAFIKKDREFRVAVVQGRTAWVAEKTPADKDAIAWNVAQGGRFDNVRWDGWPLKVVRAAVEAFELSDLDFGGVDVMTDAEGNAYVIEINSAPSLTSEYRQQCFAKCFDYIAEHGKERIPRIKERGGYRKFIHPAVCDNAILEVEHDPVRD